MHPRACTVGVEVGKAAGWASVHAPSTAACADQHLGRPLLLPDAKDHAAGVVSRDLDLLRDREGRAGR